MASIVGQSSRVVDADGFSIDELAGNVATQNDRLSIAYVKAKAGTAEPWLTLHYDEWICVLKGTMHIEQDGAAPLDVKAGMTAFIQEGTRFRPSFPEDAEYVPVCSPAFRPDRCIREDTTQEGAAVASKLQDLHKKPESEAACKPSSESPPEVLYHMTTVAEWEAAKSSDSAYYPKTYEVDGFYTHATGVPSRLLTTANHFYQDVVGDWVCVEFTRSSLRKCGIHVRDENAMPVGDKAVSDEWGSWVCPHIIGGIPTHIIDKEYPMVRDGSKYVAIKGLVEAAGGSDAIQGA
mmetsp:Transcript_50766/g.120654  ORF Transcript_50766/g.120654 Transcript_50766/m.120654 type:complete len:292 (+) Transcript_50766:73-948(+)|eukprot:CAMPEP_0178431614 /NCGR_PEP_ID=MMETSP0689_2-20121128/31946_1 /TAXON_ID=160604 /ORGANISM="Amphidinium massartii, Strain CS-259" /LENGTH=291 /DNA_ID=CAMNT_0020053547 /DNA_START=60 /DNA_END=935 /DNA_ORIENTATION=-